MAMKYFNEMKIREIKKFHGTIKPRVHEKKKSTTFFEKQYTLKTSSKQGSKKEEPIEIIYSGFDTKIFTKK